MSHTSRERTVRWSDPVATAAELRHAGGVDGLRAMIEGRLPPPPVANLLGFTLRSVERGTVTATLVPDESHYNLLGSMHGGMGATLLDTVMGCAVHTVIPHGKGYTTLNISVHYLRPITVATGEVTAIGEVVHAGRSTAIAHGRIVDANGKLYATADTTCLVFDAPPMAAR